MTPKIIGDKTYQKMHPLGRIPFDWWRIPILTNSDKQRTGYPTQKPLALYERIIKASSNEGDMVLDPFAGCATTCVAAERLNRQWIGIDIWEKAHEVVVNRLRKEVGLFGDVTFTDELPERTDDGATAAPEFNLEMRGIRPAWQRLSHKQIVAELAEAQRAKGSPEGMVTCATCGREMELPFMELDHIDPRKSGGPNDISNRILLCGPCNRTKSYKSTISQTIELNKKSGWHRPELKEAADGAGKAARRRADAVISNNGPLVGDEI